MKQKSVSKYHEPRGTARAFSERGGARTARRRWEWGRVQEEGRAIGIRNNDGRAEEATEIYVGRSRKEEEDAGVVAAAAYGRSGVGGSNDTYFLLFRTIL